MVSKTPPSPERTLALAALKLAAKKPWADLTLSLVAKTAKMPVTRAERLFPDADAIIPSIVEIFDEAMSRAETDPAASPHDHLFEIIMARFDLMQEHREGVLALAHACRERTTLLPLLLRAQIHSVQLMLKQAALNETGLHALAQQVGLLAIYNATFLRWMNDDTPDKSKTMATLDRALKYGGKIATTLFRKA